MPGPTENRAAVFTSSPQDVEVYRGGGWWAGSLLGWRHDAAGGCQVWVRVTVRGAEETAWLDLGLLRLPEPVVEAGPRPSAGGAEQQATGPDDAALTGTMAAIRAVPLPRARTRPEVPAAAAPTPTATIVAVRERSDTAAAPRRPGGRRRAPEPASGELLAVSRAAVVESRGRHRAPGSGPAGSLAGRHRASDTGVLPAVRDEAPVRLTELPGHGLPVADEPDAHLLTRPMRLGNPLDGAVPQPRGALRGGRLSGV